MSLKFKRIMKKPNIEIAKLAILSCPEITPEIELGTAIYYDYIRMVNYLLNKGVNISYNFLHAINRYINKLYTKDDIIKLLIKRGANINIQEPYDQMRCALHNIIRNDNDELLLLLLENGARTDIRDDYGNTPFHYCKSNSINIILDKFSKSSAIIPS